MRGILIKNKKHNIAGVVIGGSSPARLGLLVGVTSNGTTLAKEIQKAICAEALGISTITDVTTCLDNRLREFLLAELNVAVGTVPIYEVLPHFSSARGCGLRQAAMSTLEQHAEQGVDFFSIHISMNQELLSRLPRSNRTIPMTSRGGAMIAQIMTESRQENPFYEYLDEVLNLCRQFDITLSLASSLRPGTVADCLEPLHLQELAIQSEIVKRAHAYGVQTIVELLNHVPLSLIPTYCDIGNHLFDGSPLGALGPCPTDAAVGFDDVAGAIGAAAAIAHGVAWVNCVTAGEHCYLPPIEDTVRAIRYFRVAAHIGQIARTGNVTRDRELSVERRRNNWQAVAGLSLFPDIATAVFDKCGYRDGQACTMCDKTCPLKFHSEVSCEQVD